MVIHTTLIQIIKNITLLSEYFIPGFIFFQIICWSTSYKIKPGLHENIAIVIFSFMVRTISEEIKSENQPYSYILFISIAISIFLAIVISVLAHSKRIEKVIQKFFVKGLQDNLWLSIPDFKSNATIEAKLTDNRTIHGLIASVQESGNDPWIAIDGFTLEDGDTSRDMQYYEQDNEHAYFMVRIADIQYAVITNPDTEIY